MANKQQQAFGTWPSKISADLVASATNSISQVKLHAGDIYWLESINHEAGRQVIRCMPKGGLPETLTPKGFEVRSRVHEYGGGDYWLADDKLFFCNNDDQRLYCQSLHNPPLALTPIPTTVGSQRYSDGVVTPNGAYTICVREVHRRGATTCNELVAISTDGRQVVTPIVFGHDFYANPCLSPDGRKLAWLCWNLPDMPWDSCELWLADLDEHAQIKRPRLIAGGKHEAIYQPSFSPDQTLYFVSDRSAWWNLYRWDHGVITPIAPLNKDFAYPQWIFATNTYRFIKPNKIAAIATSFAQQTLMLIDLDKASWHTLALADDNIAPYLAADQSQLVFIAANAYSSDKILRYDLATASVQTVYNTAEKIIERKDISRPIAIKFPTTHQRFAYAFYYPPRNQYYTNNCTKELPPLIVISHGGPTSHAATRLNLKIQYWTNRGFAVVDVNYGGSTGYGREYRRRLQHRWGMVDVADCVNAAKYLVVQNLSDPARLIIKGSSAGGFTTLCALTFYDTFKLGVSYYGVSDLLGLLNDTHKFEAGYLQSLVGPYPQAKEIYHQRSPLNFPAKLNCPMLFFQGLQDKVVVPEQMETMVKVLKAKKIPYATMTFPNEGHGFRDPQNIKTALEAELYFYAQLCHFEPADDLVQIRIHHLPSD